MPGLDVFHADPFRMIQMTMAIEKVPFVPSGLTKMGIYTDSPIRTRAMMVESRAGTLSLVPFSDRGAPAVERTTEKRDARYFEISRLRVGDTIMADELAFIREFGQEAAVMEAGKEIARRMAGPTGLRQRLFLTQEFHKLAAVQGKLLDSDGSVKYDWFAQFGITPNPKVPFNLAAKTVGSLRALCAGIVRGMQRKSQGAFIENKTSVTALCGDAFFDLFISHPDITDTYKNWEAAAWMRQGSAFQTFRMFDINWINYRGTDDVVSVSAALTNGSPTVTPASLAGIVVGNQVSGANIAAGVTVASINTGAGTFDMSANYGGGNATYTLNVGAGTSFTGGGSIGIPSNQARFFPVDAPGIFQRGLAPAEGFPMLGSLGKPEYAQMIFDRDREEWVRAEMSVYPLHICTRPETLFSATMDNSVD